MDESDLGALIDRGYRYALALCHDHHQAEDLVQDAWLALRRAGAAPSAGYLFRAVRCRLIDRLRRAGPVFDDAAPEPVAPADDDQPPLPGALPEGALDAALAALAPAEREALFLMVVDGQSAAAVAELTCRPRGSVLSLVHRAKAKLRWRLASARRKAT